MTYISLLRGINVGGQKKILMSDLKSLYEDLGFTNVKTYIQSGNVIFNTDKKSSNEVLADKISTKIADKYGFDVSVFVIQTEELIAITDLFPFATKADLNPKKTFATLLNQKPAEKDVQKLEHIDISPDEFHVFDNVIFWHYESNDTSKLSNNFFEKKLKVVGTSRNWATINKLIELTNE